MKGNSASPKSPLTSMPTWLNTFRYSATSVFFFARVFTTTSSNRSHLMSGTTDMVKGRLKEAAGAVTGNDELRTEGKTDQAIGKIKQVAEKAVDKVEQAVKKVRE